MPLQGRTVGVVCAPEVGSEGASYVPGREPWDLPVVREIEAECTRQGGRTCVVPLPTGSRGERRAVGAAVEDALARGAGIIICIQLYDSPTLLDEMRRAVAAGGVGGVFVVSRALAEPVPHVYPDQFYAGYQAAQHLLDAGYTRLLFLATIESRWVDERIAGARAAISRAGVSGNVLAVAPERASARLVAEDHPAEPVVIETARAQMRAAAKKCRMGRPGEWGVIAANDIAGFGVLDELAREGRAPGRGVGVIGFDDNSDSRLRGMSSLRMPLVEIGRAATELAAATLVGSPVSPQTRLLWQLAARASTSRTSPNMVRT
jgi:DNA-binding LacI/PurR family transcriptional regulator